MKWVEGVCSAVSIGWCVEHLDDILGIIALVVNVIILLSNVIYKIWQKFKKQDDSDIDYIMLAKFSEDLKKYYEKNNIQD